MFALNEHPLRRRLAEEMHSRPYGQYYSPLKVAHLAAISGETAPDLDREAVARLCRTMSVKPPAKADSHFTIDLGPCTLKWERHTEFSTYTFFEEDPSLNGFKEPVLRHLPDDWISNLPGDLIVAAHLIIQGKDEPDRTVEEIAHFFDGNTLTGSAVLDGRAEVWTDFMVHADGFSRFLIRDIKLSGRQTGRLVQRLLEVETYRMMAMLAFPVAKRFQPKVAEAEHKLGSIVLALSDPEKADGDKELLGKLSDLSAELEAISGATGYRLGATRAYRALVEQRLCELREKRLDQVQPSGEFLERRMAPAMKTCESLGERQEALSRRTARAADLLRTRVNVTLNEQNRSLLESMDHRAHVQLRLQETVEGLSVVAISYYMVGLVAYGAKAAKGAGLPVNPDIAIGLAIPAVLAFVFLGVRRLRKALTKGGQ